MVQAASGVARENPPGLSRDPPGLFDEGSALSSKGGHEKPVRIVKGGQKRETVSTYQPAKIPVRGFRFKIDVRLQKLIHDRFILGFGE